MKFELEDKKLIAILKDNEMLNTNKIENLIWAGINFATFIREFRESEKSAIENLKVNIKIAYNLKCE